MAASNPSFLLSKEQTTRLDALASELQQSGLFWASGYLAGLASGRAPMLHVVPQPAAAQAAAVAQPLTIIYGSQTGNAKRVAEQLARDAEAAGLQVKLHRADAYKTRQLKDETFLYVVISTHSEGDLVDPPDDSRDFIEFLESRRAPKLPQLRYAVLALGDTSYPDFCGIGRKVDERLAALGATRVQPRGEADVDIESIATPWAEQAVQKAREELLADEPAAATPDSGVVTPLHPGSTAVASLWTRAKPFQAEVLARQTIVAADSDKDVHHIELLLEGSGLRYEPGDALGVWPQQSDDLVAAVLQELQLDGKEAVTHEGQTLELAQWLRERRELTVLTRPFIAAHAERGQHPELQALLEPDPQARAQLGELLQTQQLIDLLRRWPTPWDATALVAALRPLAPRMYSIASAQSVVEEEVHLTVQRVHFERDGQERWGVATRYLCDLNEGETVPVFIESNDRFRLPADGKRDVIMIGPGTGVAPFRAFVQEREESGAEGRNWLFFGNPHRSSDFLYQLEWQQALREGVLTHLSVAFSRDQAHKIYVQDRLREHAAELWDWLQGGAHLYVCGDADRMAPDVHAALLQIAVEQGGQSSEQAEDWLKRLTREGRYARDVY